MSGQVEPVEEEFKEPYYVLNTFIVHFSHKGNNFALIEAHRMRVNGHGDLLFYDHKNSNEPVMVYAAGVWRTVSVYGEGRPRMTRYLPHEIRKPTFKYENEVCTRLNYESRLRRVF